jgi:small subunit ribosomal protein S19
MADNLDFKKKEFTYRGKTVAELKELDVREFAKYLRARERRTVLKNFQKLEDFIRRSKTKIKKGKQIRTHQRDIVIVPEMVGMKIQVHTGKIFSPIEIVGEMIGHRLGEFAPTRQRIKHSKAGVGATKGTKFKSKK